MILLYCWLHNAKKNFGKIIAGRKHNGHEHDMPGMIFIFLTDLCFSCSRLDCTQYYVQILVAWLKTVMVKHITKKYLDLS